ncbi:MAG: VOC family protein [Acidobacteriota bacterium]|nr:VOC family protein [Acidobacteriota bacterium]
MKGIHVYLNFDGNCREAMTFYKAALGGELQMMTFGETKQGDAKDSDRIMHARLTVGPVVMMASDTMSSMTLTRGNDFFVSVDCESKEEVDRFSKALGHGGNVMLAPQEMFWGAYFGMLTDKFGVQWMFNFDKPTA